MAGQPGENSRGQDSQDKTAGTEQPGQDNHGRITRRGQPGQSSRDRIAGTVQRGQDNHGRTAGAGPSGQNS
jgi:hypothetical protein